MLKIKKALVIMGLIGTIGGSSLKGFDVWYEGQLEACEEKIEASDFTQSQINAANNVIDKQLTSQFEKIFSGKELYTRTYESHYYNYQIEE